MLIAFKFHFFLQQNLFCSLPSNILFEREIRKVVMDLVFTSYLIRKQMCKTMFLFYKTFCSTVCVTIEYFSF